MKIINESTETDIQTMEHAELNVWYEVETLSYSKKACARVNGSTLIFIGDDGSITWTYAKSAYRYKILSTIGKLKAIPE